MSHSSAMGSQSRASQVLLQTPSSSVLPIPVAAISLAQEDPRGHNMGLILPTLLHAP